MSTIIVRPATDAELTLVRDSWVRSLGAKPKDIGGDPYIAVGRGGLSPRAWYAAHRALIEQYLRESTVTVAAHGTHPDVALAWMCHDGGTLHYVFTLRDARRKGLASKLLASLEPGFRCSHMTADGQSLLTAQRRRRAA